MFVPLTANARMLCPTLLVSARGVSLSESEGSHQHHMCTHALQEPACMLPVFQPCPCCSHKFRGAQQQNCIHVLSGIFYAIIFCLRICVAHISVWDSGMLWADMTSMCRERGRSGSSSGGLGGAGGGGQSELQLQRQRVITRRKALQRKLSEVRRITALCFGF